MISEWVEKCWSLVLGEEWLTVEIKRHSTRSIKSMHQEKESRQSHYLILGKAAQERKEGRKEGRNEGWDGQQVRETSGGESKKQRGRSGSSATLRTYPAATNNNSNFSRCGVVAAYKIRC